MLAMMVEEAPVVTTPEVGVGVVSPRGGREAATMSL